MACTVERLRQAARNVPVVLLLGRLKNEGLETPSIPTQPSDLYGYVSLLIQLVSNRTFHLIYISAPPGALIRGLRVLVC